MRKSKIEKSGFNYYLKEDILKGYQEKPVELRLKWLYQINKLRKYYPKEIIYDAYRQGIYYISEINDIILGIKKSDLYISFYY